MTENRRDWPVPQRSWLMRMNWHELLFMHWPIAASSIRGLIPSQLDVDTFDGTAWIGLVPFHMTGVSPRFVPDVPGMSAFPELNVRTYVTYRGEKPGVWFFSLDASQWIAVRAARRFFHLPYMDAKIDVKHESDSIVFQSRRVHRGEPTADLDVTYAPEGAPFRTEPGTLEHFLTARYCLYCASRRHVYRGDIDHPPWEIQTARCEVRQNTMVDWLGIELPDQAPLLHYANRTDAIAWSNQRLC